MSSIAVPKNNLKDFHSGIYMDLMLFFVVKSTDLEVADIFQLLNNAKKLAVHSLNAAQKREL